MRVNLRPGLFTTNCTANYVVILRPSLDLVCDLLTKIHQILQFFNDNLSNACRERQ